MTDTIFALSSGAPPAAIAVIRVSGPDAAKATLALCGSLPSPRRAVVRTLRNSAGEPLDEALVLWFPGPASATGEDCLELHCHGGRAIVAAVLAAFDGMEGLRAAQPGEFTRRAFGNGRIDLAQAEALGDLLAAETELQRRVAHKAYGGLLSRKVEDWRDQVLALSGMVEASLDFSDEDDVPVPEGLMQAMAGLAAEIDAILAAPRTERLQDGIRVALAGPPNSGKSSLFNALSGKDRAIVTPFAGTTRDVLEAPVALDGVPIVLIDTAGLRAEGAEMIEAMGIERAEAAIEAADLVLWLGQEGCGPPGALEIAPRCDAADAVHKHAPDHVVSAVTGEGIAGLASGIAMRARRLLPKPSETTINARQAQLLGEANLALRDPPLDPLLIAESLRLARHAFDRIVGRAHVEDMLDALFGRFCIGK